MIAKSLTIVMFVSGLLSLNAIDPRFIRLACLEVYPGDPSWSVLKQSFENFMTIIYNQMNSQVLAQQNSQALRDLSSKFVGEPAPQHKWFYNSAKSEIAEKELQISENLKLSTFQSNLVADLFSNAPSDFVPTSYYIVLPSGATLISYKIEAISGYFYESVVYLLNGMYYYAQYNTGIKISNIKPDQAISRNLKGENSHKIASNNGISAILDKITLVKGFISSNINLINACYHQNYSNSQKVNLPLNFFSKFLNNAY
jgi:hypothetical protein